VYSSIATTGHIIAHGNTWKGPIFAGNNFESLSCITASLSSPSTAPYYIPSRTLPQGILPVQAIVTRGVGILLRRSTNMELAFWKRVVQIVKYRFDHGKTNMESQSLFSKIKII
jgi:hypothetical protein